MSCGPAGIRVRDGLLDKLDRVVGAALQPAFGPAPVPASVGVETDLRCRAGSAAQRSSSMAISSAGSPTATFHLKIRKPASAVGRSPARPSAARPAGNSAATGEMSRARLIRRVNPAASRQRPTAQPRPRAARRAGARARTFRQRPRPARTRRSPARPTPGAHRLRLVHRLTSKSLHRRDFAPAGSSLPRRPEDQSLPFAPNPMGRPDRHPKWQPVASKFKSIRRHGRPRTKKPFAFAYNRLISLMATFTTLP